MAEVLPLDDSGYQVCRICQKNLPLGDFARNSECRLGVLKICKKCGAAQARAWYVANLDKAFDTQLRRKFGITREQYDAMLAEQGGVCAICGAPPIAYRNNRRRQGHMITARLVVDHDHATGKVRGLLCSACNRGIGFLKDDADTVRLALQYLEESEGVAGVAPRSRPRRKLTEADIEWIRSGYGGLTQKQAAAKLGVDPSVISRISTGAERR